MKALTVDQACVCMVMFVVFNGVMLFLMFQLYLRYRAWFDRCLGRLGDCLFARPMRWLLRHKPS